MVIALTLLFLVAPVQAWLSWSPQGDRFVHAIEGKMYVVNPYTEEVTYLGRGSNPQWHPYRELILYGHVFTIHPDGTGKKKVGDGQSAGWSPDGKRYAYWGYGEIEIMHQGEPFPISVPVIWIGELDGEEKVQEIFLGEKTLNVLSWGEDGISYTEVSGWAIRSFFVQFVLTIDPDNGEQVYPPERISCSSNTIYSSDPGRVACIYVEHRLEQDQDPPPDWVPERRFYILEEGGEETEIGEDLDVLGASWSPDGEILVFDALVEPGVRELFYVENDHPEEIKQLTFDGQWKFFPEWSPAGDLILYLDGQVSY